MEVYAPDNLTGRLETMNKKLDLVALGFRLDRALGPFNGDLSNSRT